MELQLECLLGAKALCITYERYTSYIDMKTSFLTGTEGRNSHLPGRFVFRTLSAT